MRIQTRFNFKQEDFDPILLRLPKTFYLGTVGYPRSRLGLLKKSHYKSRQCRGKNVAETILKNPRDLFKLSPRVQTCNKRGEKLWKK